MIKDGFRIHVTASFAVAFVAAVASNAVDVRKIRVINVKVVEEVEPLYKGAVDCVVNTVKAEGQEQDARMKTYLQLLLLLPLLKHRLKVLLIIVAELVLLGVLGTLTLMVVHTTKVRFNTFGSIAIVGNIMMYAAP
uniref:Mitochondrial dicarboxylate carrier n=1 Tax=Tanacetum cinerariifolium TaxID=118510 RepID=A0A699K2A8_TANCI|nr:mitochondrial dicarboxylate carrier [Tanacetum cinerariifolium]